MEIAFAAIYDARDMRRGSGTFYYLCRELEQQGHRVTHLGPLNYKYSLVSRVVRRLARLGGRRYMSHLDPFVGAGLGRQVCARLKGVTSDILLTNDYAIAAFTRPGRPAVLYTDVMITHNHIERRLPYARMGNLSAIMLALARHTIRQGLRAAALCAFPAEWSAREASQYVPTPSKYLVIPFGANLDDPGPEVAARRRLADNRLSLLFVGKDWKLKGGDVALDTLQAILAERVDARLHIVGVMPPATAALPDGVTIHGVLDKTNARDLAALLELYRQCDLLVFPSIAEGFGIAPIEAAAYGIPTLGYRTLGLSSAIQHNQSGVLLELGQDGKSFAQAALRLQRNPAEYQRLSRGARAYYVERANWPAAVRRLVAAAQPLVD